MMSGMRTSVPSRAQWLQRLALRRNDKVAFVLSGGGPLGALQVGALHALLEEGIRPDMVVGSSVGALNASLLAFHPTTHGVNRLERIWRNLEDKDLFPGGRFRASWARMLARGNKVFENTGLRRLALNRLGNAHFEDAQLRLAIVATELDRGTERVFTSGPIIEPLLASAAMPGVFPPVEIEGKLYIDGGVSNNVPIAPAVEMGAKTIYIMDATQHAAVRRPLVRPMDYLLHAFSLARAHRLVLDEALYGEKVRLVMVPMGPLDFFVPFASLEYTDRLIDIGYEETSKFLTGRVERTTEAAGKSVIEAAAPDL
jgi:NTE family protein